MEIRISQQLLLFGQSVLAGIAAAVLYDLLRPLRLRLPALQPWVDGSFCLWVGLSLFLLALRQNLGELRGFVLLGAVGGAVLFFSALSNLLRDVWDFWFSVLCRWVQLLLFPLRRFLLLEKKIKRYGKNIFYFAKKYYTMKGVGSFANRRKGAHYGKKASKHQSAPARQNRSPG